MKFTDKDYNTLVEQQTEAINDRKLNPSKQGDNFILSAKDEKKLDKVWEKIHKQNEKKK